MWMLQSRRDVQCIMVVGLVLALSGSLDVLAAETESGTTLKWVGCGISKKAYMTDMAKAFEAESGIKIDVQGGGATRGIRDVASLDADIGGTCRNKLFRNKKEKNAWHSLWMCWMRIV